MKGMNSPRSREVLLFCLSREQVVVCLSLPRVYLGSETQEHRLVQKNIQETAALLTET